MNLADFISKYNGKFVDFDGVYGAQCVDLAQVYNRDVVGGAPLAPGGNAVDVFDRYPTDKYTRVPNGANNTPPAGAIVIWEQNARVFTGPPGHIAIATGDGDGMHFTSLDQNWPDGSPCRLVTHTYDGVRGWLVPRVAATPTPATQGAPPDAATAVASLMRHAAALSSHPSVAGTNQLIADIRAKWPASFSK